MKNWQRIAIFMTYLIISIPFVIAQELNIQKFQGQDNVRGYAKSHDQFTVEALAKIPGEETIHKEQLRLYYEGMYTHFDSCNATTGGHLCRLYEPNFESYQPLDLTVELRDNSENVVGQENLRLNIDNQAPVIKEMNAEPKISNGPVEITYSAEDYALTYGDTSECSGLKTITVKSGTTTIATDSASIGECTKDNTLPVNFDTGGTKQICITALDYLNHASPPTCTEVKIDKAPPTIEELNILDEQGFIITHVHTGEERQATINAVITDDGEVDRETVAASFAQLNPNLPDHIPPDAAQNDIYTWTNIPVSEVSQCKINVIASDTLGNSNTRDFPCAIKADDTAPTLKTFIADSTRDGLPLYGFGTQITIQFEDKDNTGAPGIGLQNRNVFLDLSPIGMDPATEADICSKTSGAEWECTWLLIPPLATPEGTYTITLLAESADDLGNEIGIPQTYNIIYDNTGPLQPQIIEAKVVTGQAGITYTGGAVRGDYAHYKVRSKDFTTAFANFSDIGGGDKEPTTGCEDAEGGGQDCTFISAVLLDGPYTAKIGFDFYDDAQNKASTSTTLEIYAIENATTTNYWTKPSITCTPRVINRATASIMPTIASCRIDLSSPNPKVSTLAIAGPTAPDQCTGDIDLNVNDLYMINTAEGSKSPYLFIVLEAKDYYMSKLNISCPITIYSKREETIAGTKRYYVTPIPQTIQANITLQFYNTTMGGIHDNIDRKINHAMKNSFANAEWIGQLRQYMYYAEMICWIKNLLSTVISTLYMLTTLLTGIAGVLKITTYTKAAGDVVAQAGVGLCEGEEKISEEIFGEAGKPILEFLNGACALVNCGSTGMQSGPGYLGGGVPWCQDPLKLKDTDLGEMAGAAGVSLYPSIKDSLILSILCICLPGIIYNVEKLRQVHCFEAVCLNDYVKEQGYPVSYCDEMKGYLTCTFVMGEFFSIMPFANFFDKLIDMVITWISDPVSLFTTALGAACQSLCEDDGTVIPVNLLLFIGCALLKTLSVLMESTAAIKKMTDTENNFWNSPGNQYCTRMQEIKEEMKE